MRRPVVLITGASGEMGHGLITRLAAEGTRPILTLDLKALDPSLGRLVAREFTGSILDRSVLERILSEYEIDMIFHLAALLSTRGEFTPVTAHQVNVEGTINLLEFAQSERQSHGRPVTFLYPSSIAAYGLSDLATKQMAGKVKEDELQQADDDVRLQQAVLPSTSGATTRSSTSSSPPSSKRARVDFRCLRFPGLISAVTVPSGGTSDYAPEMIHAAAEGKPYACFVRPDTRIPFMAMPDGVDALLKLAAAPGGTLSRQVYNVGSFAPVGRGDPRPRPQVVPGRRGHVRARPQAAGHRGLVARGRGRQRRAFRLGIRAEVRPRVRILRLPHPDDPRALPEGVKRPDSLLLELRRELAAAGTPERAAGARAYMKSSMPFHGVDVKTLRAICRKAFAAHPVGSAAAWRKDIVAIWRGATFREERYAAIELTGDRRARPFQTMAALPMYEEMIVTGAWWDLVDALATKRLGEILRNEPAPMRKAMRTWSRDADMWKRRSAILCQVTFKKDTDLDLLFALIEPSLGSKEFFLRKAIGWALRSYAWTDEKPIVRYVEKNGARLSPLSVREALKNVR